MIDYNEELNTHIHYLETQLENLKGVSQGFLIKDEVGNVIDRVGRISNNPYWYQEFYKQNKRRPSKKDLINIAKEHLEYGFYDNWGFIPPLKDRM